jgi:hypothetical protein
MTAVKRQTCLIMPSQLIAQTEVVRLTSGYKDEVENGENNMYKDYCDRFCNTG